MTKAARITATIASSLSLVAGFAGVASASPASIHHTGADSYNKIKYSTYVKTEVNNNNRVRLTNNNPQTAVSGDAKATKNTTSGDVWTGDAWNESNLNANVRVNNSSSTAAALDGPACGCGGGGGGAEIHHTGADSYNAITSKTVVKTEVNNNNNVRITNNNDQTAVSGDASAYKNTTVGSVSTGDASNTSNATFDVTITN